MNERPYHIYAIGNAPIDYVSHVKESYLQDNNFIKGACTTIEELSLVDKIKKELTFTTIEPGGGAANMACCIRELGAFSAFTGKFADDEAGMMFAKSMNDAGVALKAQPGDSKLGTAQIFVLNTDDDERTFAAYYGQSATLCPEDLDETSIKNAAMTYLDCFCLACEKGFETLETAAKTARKYNKRVVLNTNDPNIVSSYKAQIIHLLEPGDVIISNISEAQILTEKSAPMEIYQNLLDYGVEGAITMGKEGSLVFRDQNFLFISTAREQGPLVNTNGAGDAYAAGYCYGLLNNEDIKTCGHMGSYCAAKIITLDSPRPSKGCFELKEMEQ
jgi:sugar/nucleoside kinase (ribokinase family)